MSQATGWTIDYIVWNISVQQLVLLGQASKEIMNESEKKRLEDTEDPEATLKTLLGADIFEGR